MIEFGYWWLGGDQILRMEKMEKLKAWMEINILLLGEEVKVLRVLKAMTVKSRPWPAHPTIRLLL